MLPWRRGHVNSAVLRRVTAVLEFHALRNQALAAFLTAVAQDAPAGSGGHAGAETELVFTGALGRLVSAFAHGCGLVEGGNLRPPGGSGDETLCTRKGLSIHQWQKFSGREQD